MKGKEDIFRLIPKVDEILEEKDIKNLIGPMPRRTLLESVREELEILREDIREDRLDESGINERLGNLPARIIEKARKKDSYELRRVINGTGVVIHTNIGRSLIGERVMDNIKQIASNYSNLEYDLGQGTRGERYSHLKNIIKKITGGEDAMVVNNNAAAVLLVLSTLAKDKEVIVSRGELIEIGGAFRIPEVMEESGARLRAVGTTNKTHLRDYDHAITEDTGALLKVHTSNYRILGFTSSVSTEDLYGLKEKYKIPLIEDLGSGVLIDLSKYGLEYEPTVQETIKKGVDVVTFSGDKLLGGPQAGIIIGKKKYIDAMKKNPLTRAFRIDKFTISALEATLKLYLDEKDAIENIPTLNMLTVDLDTLLKKSAILHNKIKEKINFNDCRLEEVESYSEVGGGSLPLEKIPTRAIKITLENHSLAEFEKNLRAYEIPIIARVYRDSLYLDLRTIREEEFDIIADGLVYGLNKLKGCS